VLPRKDSDFYKLKHVHEKLCFLNGMPKPYMTAGMRDPQFTHFKCNSRSITSAAQDKAYGALKDNWGPSHSAFFLANPHDRDAMHAACQLLRNLAGRGFKSFEFISPFEDLRFTKSEEHDIRELYILTGANEADVEMTQRIRRWIRQPHGASIWVVGVVSDPYQWASQKLGCVPDYMFWLKRGGVSAG
jgi:hypothetical protein